MKPSDIIAQLISELPKHTEIFSTSVQVTSLTRSGTTVTAVCDEPHELTDGGTVLITGASSPVLVNSLTEEGGVVTGVTDTPHDITEDYTEEVTISGATPSGYNGTFTPLTANNRKTFQYSVDETLVDATGTILLYDGKDRGYNGEKTVAVVDTTTFTFEITETPYEVAGGTIFAHTSVNAGFSISIDRFMDLYTQKEDNSGKSWAVVVMGDVTASNNRFIESDSNDRFSPGSEYRQKLPEQFAVYTIIPCRDQLAGQDARDTVEDIKGPLMKSLLGVKFPTYFSIEKQFGTTLLNHGFYGYTGAYYVHEFVFEMVSETVFSDIINPDFNVAFRDITLGLQNPFIQVIMTTDVNLDDEPLDE